jgi:hypothetical protein
MLLLRTLLRLLKSILEKATITAISTKLIPIAKRNFGKKIHSAN